MTTSLGFTSADFRLESAAAIAPATVRVRFTTDPKAVNPVGAGDGLNPANYQLGGPGPSVIVVGVNPVFGDPQALDLFASSALTAGTWTLLVLGVTAEDGSALIPPNTLSFAVSASAPQDSVTGGAEDSTILDALKDSMGTAFKGEGWDALLYALSLGDTYVSDTARAAFDQLFLATSEGRFLDRNASEQGVVRPDGVGISDELFRQLAIQMSTAKVTYDALWRILEVFYGSAAVRAVVEAGLDEPYAIQDQTQLLLEIDGGDTLPITFRNADFAQLGQARAIEVAAVITRQMRQLGIQGWATSVLNPETQRNRVRIFSPSLGLASKIRIVGGLAQNKLRFPTIIDAFASMAPGDQLSVTVPTPGTAVYNILNQPVDYVSVLHEGDFVNVSAADALAVNKGSFEIVSVSIVWNGVNYDQSFTVKNPLAVAQSPIEIDNDEDFVFWRDPPALLPSSKALISGAEDNALLLDLPVSTVVVEREPLRASYLQGQAEVAVDTAILGTDGILTVTTSSAHGLSIGNQVLIDEILAEIGTVNVVAGASGSVGNNGTMAASHVSVSTILRSPDTLTARHGHHMVTLPNGRILIVGGEFAGTYYQDSVTFRLTGGSVTANGRIGRTYNYAVAGVSALASRARGVMLPVSGNGTLAPGALQLGGQTTAGAAAAGGQLYNQNLDSWSLVSAAYTARYNTSGARVLNPSDGTEVFILSSGQTGAATATTQITRFTSAGGTLVMNNHSDLVSGRAQSAACAIDDNTALICGGGDPTASMLPFTSSILVTYAGTITAVGQMTIGRYAHALVPIGGGRALAIGGIGRNASQASTNSLVADIEMFDMLTKSWTVVGRLRVPRTNPQCHLIGNKVYIVGGASGLLAGVSPITPTVITEVYDIVEKTLTTAPNLISVGSHAYAASAQTDGIIFVYGGTTDASGAVNTAWGVVPGADVQTPRFSLNSVFKVASTPTATSFTVSGFPTGNYLSFTGTASMQRVSAPASAQAIGPFLMNPTEGPAITEVEAVVGVAINANSQVGILTVDDATDFPDEEGWLAFNAGYANQLFPIRYLGRISDTQLALDFEYVFEKDVPVNSKVTLLASKGAVEIEAPEDRGLAYITDASAGRLAAERFLADAVMCGPELNFRVRYPSDKGLGNAGQPYTGTLKLSDAIRVWGGDELTLEVAAAQEEDDL